MKNSPSTQFENIAEERIVLGRLLQAPEAAFSQVGDFLKPEHFAVDVHQKIYAAIKDMLTEGRKAPLVAILARVGDEYGDGQSTMTLLTAMLRDAENGDLEGAGVIVELWKRRQFIAELQRAMKEITNPNTHIDDLMSDHELRFQEIGQNSATTPILTIGEIARQALAKSRATKTSGSIPGFDTGLPSLDEIMGRIHPGDLGFIGADPNAGKTILAQQIAHHVSHNLKRSVAFFQLEMSAEDMGRRYLAGEANMSTSQVEEGAYDFDQAEYLEAAAASVANDRLWIDDRPDLAIEQIADRCAALKRRPEGLDLALVDHLLKVEAYGSFKDYFARVKYITGRGKIVAKKLGIALIFLVHRTRGSQRNSPIPTMRDFDGGSSIERDADFVLGLTRPDYYLEEEKPDDMDSAAGRKWTERWHLVKNTIDIYYLKGRRAKRGTMRSFKIDGRLSRISEIEKKNG